jgi:hypothetical protein
VRRARDLLAPLLILACLPTTTHAAQSAKLNVTFTPDRLGQTTTINFNIKIATPADYAPPPLTKIDIRYPRELGLAISELGLATCPSARLETFGPASCPANSRMGKGEALAEITFGPDVIHETAEVEIIRAPEQNGHLALLFYANATNPVSAPLVFPGLLLPTPPPNDENIQINVPLIPSLPDAPDVAITQLHATLGPLGLTYYENVHGQREAYHPKGILLPHTCPHNGFPFAAELTFQNHTHTNTHTTIPCPTPRHQPVNSQS